MLDALNSLLDPYDRKARVAPALLCGLPLFVSMALLIPEIGTIWATVGGLLLYCGGATFLAQIGRDRGKVLESSLHEAWGGTPSVAMLRHRDSRLNALTKNRYRTFLQRAVPEVTLASPAGRTVSVPKKPRSDTKARTPGYWRRHRTANGSGCCFGKTSTMDFGEMPGLSGRGRSAWRRSRLSLSVWPHLILGRETSRLQSKRSAWGGGRASC